MDNQRADYELAYFELQRAFQDYGDSPAFADVCHAVEERLIDRYPDEESEIIEMIVAWQAKLRGRPKDLVGFV